MFENRTWFNLVTSKYKTELPCKDAIYRFLSYHRFAWHRFLLLLSARFVSIVARLTPSQRVKVFIERKGTQLLFEAVSSCYERRSIVITTNLPFDEWNTIFYDEKLTMAILDRVVHHGHLVMHEGQSYRLSHHTPYPIKP